MKITLKLVRQVLKDALGFESFVASFITGVREDNNHPTAGIAKDGVLAYNPEFVSRYVTRKKDMFSLIFHELLHPMFGHFIYDSGRVENIAADAVINAVISTLYPDRSREGNLFKKTPVFSLSLTNEGGCDYNRAGVKGRNVNPQTWGRTGDQGRYCRTDGIWRTRARPPIIMSS